MTRYPLNARGFICVLGFVTASCQSSAPPTPPTDSNVSATAEALCLTGPAFPSCYGNCGRLVCSPIDPGACCACDDGCSLRGDCCCDFPTYCPPPGSCIGSLVPASSDERVAAIAVGPAGEVYVAGTRATTSGFSTDRVDGFLRRVNPTTFATIWDRAVDDCFWDAVYGVAVLPQGDVVITGATRNGGFATTPTRLLVRRYTAAGNMVWEATPTTGLGAVVGAALAVDPTNATIVVAGTVATSTTSAVLFARIDGAGSVRLLTTIPSPVPRTGRAIAVDGSGNIAIVGDDVSGPTHLIALNASGSVRWIATDVAGSTGARVAFGSAGDPYLVSTVSSTSGTVTTRVGGLSRFSPSGSLLFRDVLDVSSVRHATLLSGLAINGATAVVAGSAVNTAGVQEPFVREIASSGSVVATHVHAGTSVMAVSGVALSGARALLAAQTLPSAGLSGTLIVADTL